MRVLEANLRELSGHHWPLKKKARHDGRAQDFKRIALPRLRPIPVINLLLGLILG